MKKFKLFTPILACIPATVMPLTALANCSCSNLDYTGITKAIKEDTLDYCAQLCEKGSFRATWDSEQVFTKIKSILADLKIEQVYEDDWSVEADKDFKEAHQESKVVGAYGNMWYDIPATEGCDKWPKIILSSYYDVDYDCSDEVKQQIKENGIKLKIDEETQTIQSENNKYACGFVNGIGVAVNLAFAKNHTKFNHGPIRLLFTADSGDSSPHYASGSDYLRVKQASLGDDKKPFDTPFVINTDGYNQGNIFVSAAGIHQCQVYKKEWAEASKVETGTETIYKNNPYIYDIEVSGLQGGHSALDIDSGYANAIKILFQVITNNLAGFRLIDFHCADDASSYRIPSYAKARILIAPIYSGEKDITDQKVQSRIDNLTETYKVSYPKDKEKISITKTRITASDDIYALDEDKSNQVCIFGNAIPYGGRAWYDEELKQVKTSVNISPFNLKMDETTHKVNLETAVTCRSGSSDHLEVFSGEIHSYIQWLLGIKHQEGLTDYSTPVWENTQDSHKTPNAMAQLMKDAYKRFRYTPSEVNCHGWLEGACYPAIIKTLNPKTLEETIPFIAAIGPTVVNPQTKNEKLYSSTLNSMIRVMIYVLFNAQALKDKW